MKVVIMTPQLPGYFSLGVLKGPAPPRGFPDLPHKGMNSFTTFRVLHQGSLGSSLFQPKVLDFQIFLFLHTPISFKSQHYSGVNFSSPSFLCSRNQCASPRALPPSSFARPERHCSPRPECRGRAALGSLGGGGRLCLSRGRAGTMRKKKGKEKKEEKKKKKKKKKRGKKKGKKRKKKNKSMHK